MKTKKDKKGIHNRRPHGTWSDYPGKDERKRGRAFFKSVRHKILMHVPLSEEEEKFRERFNVTENTKMDFTGKPLAISWRRI